LSRATCPVIARPGRLGRRGGHPAVPMPQGATWRCRVGTAISFEGSTDPSKPHRSRGVDSRRGRRRASPRIVARIVIPAMAGDPRRITRPDRRSPPYGPAGRPSSAVPQEINAW
jgi:hypothetical protein